MTFSNNLITAKNDKSENLVMLIIMITITIMTTLVVIKTVWIKKRIMTIISDSLLHHNEGLSSLKL